MAGLARPGPIARIALVAAMVATAVVGLAPAGDATAASLPRWTGGIDLYRSGVFTTQQTWRWCTAADVQIMRNIVDHRSDHSRSSQKRYFDYMRAHNRYDIPVADGVDPAGWTAGLRRFVDRSYRLVASGSFSSALRSAVTSLRRTNLPVGITVSHGNHAWVLTGFTATADPLVTSRFTVTSVRVTGPLWGLQSTSYGYDMRPDRKLTPRQLRGFFTPWHYAGVRMAWEGRWVSVQPVATSRAGSSTRSPAPTRRPTARPRATPEPTPSPTMTAGVAPSPAAAASAAPALTGTPSPSDGTGGSPAGDPLTAAAGGIEPSPSLDPAVDPAAVGAPGSPAWDPLRSGAGIILALVALALVALVALGAFALAWRVRVARRSRPG